MRAPRPEGAIAPVPPALRPGAPGTAPVRNRPEWTCDERGNAVVCAREADAGAMQQWMALLVDGKAEVTRPTRGGADRYGNMPNRFRDGNPPRITCTCVWPMRKTGAAWIFAAPEVGGEILLVCNVDNRALVVYPDTMRGGRSPWTRIAALGLRADAPYKYVASPEPVAPADLDRDGLPALVASRSEPNRWRDPDGHRPRVFRNQRGFRLEPHRISIRGSDLTGDRFLDLDVAAGRLVPPEDAR